MFYLLLTFSRLPNEYIISFIPQYIKHKQNPEKKKSSNPVKFGHIFLVAKQICNIIPQSRNTNKTQKKKFHNPVATGFNERRDRAAEAKARSRGAVLRSQLARCCDRDRCEGEIAIRDDEFGSRTIGFGV